MYHLIDQNAAAVAQAAAKLGDLSNYQRLRFAFPTADIPNDIAFQRLYRRYWRMYVGRFSEAFYVRYFSLMDECRRETCTDVAHILHELSGLGSVARGLQFSFATKLAHTVDPRLPVYDSLVAAFYFYAPPPANLPLVDRVTSLLEFYDFLRREYSRILDHGLLARAIHEFRAHWTIDPTIPDQRLIDWLLWGWVSYLRTGVQHRGECLFT